MNKQSGQVVVGGLLLMILLLFAVGYFLYVSESFLRLFTNTEQTSIDTISKTSKYANILNEISINNQNIIASLTVTENALLQAIEHSLYIAFHQPYWRTYAFNKKGNTNNKLDNESVNAIKKIFQAYSLTSARGFFIARSLSEKNKNLLHKLPAKLRSTFIQSTNAQVNCLALYAEKKYYQKPGIVNLPTIASAIYNFYLQQNLNKNCSIEHKVTALNKFMEFSLPNFSVDEVDDILSYANLDKLINNRSNNIQYGIYYVAFNKADKFIAATKFFSKDHNKKTDEKFAVIENFLSKIPFFYNINLAQRKKLEKSKFINQFMLSHPLIYCSPTTDKCILSENNFLHAFFSPHWAVTGIYQ